MTEIPNLVADGITDEMTAETNAKFELWDKAIKEEWIDGGIRTQQREAYQLLRDPTLFAYAFFKDQNQKPLKFFPYQDMILNDILIKKKSDRYLFVAANQIGKSFALCYMALFYALNNVGKTVLMTSKTLVQAKDLLRQIKNLMRNSSLDFSYDTADTDTKTELYFKHYSEKFNEKGEPIRLNDSRIIVVPATEAALGYSVDLALCLPYNEKIMTNKGEIKIGEIVEKKLDVEVLTLNEKTNKLEFKPIKKYIEKNLDNKKIYEIKSQKDRVFCTQDHKIYTDKGWIKAQDLNLKHKVYKLQKTISYYGKKNGSISQKTRISIFKKTITNNLWRDFRRWMFKQKKKKCCNGILSRDKTKTLSSMEEKTIRTFCRESKCREKLEWRFNNTSFFNICSSNINTVMERNKIYYKRISKQIRTTWFSNMVYGRWFKHKTSIKIKYSRIFKKTKYSIPRMVFRKIWDFFYYKGRQEKKSILFRDFSKKSKNIYGTNSNTHSSCIKIQNNNSRMSKMSKIVHSRIFRNFLFRFMQIKESKRYKNEICKKKKCFKKNTCKLYNLWNKFLSCLWKTKMLFKSLQSKKSKENEIWCKKDKVYDLTIEGNHNFFANNILVHNCDEIAFYDDSEHFYMQILQPRTYATKGTIVMFSNPNGQMGLYWDLWSKNKRYRKYRFNFLDNPRNTQKEFDQLAEEMPQEKIDSTLLAIFTNAEGGFLTLNERKAMFEERSNSLPVVFTQPVTIAFDFAKSRDRTVRMIGIPTNFEGKKGVYIYEIKEYPSGTEYTEILRELQELIDDYGAKNIDMVAFDASGVGKALEEFMKIMGRIGVSIKPVDFTLQSKSRMYTSLKLLAERNVSGMRSLKMPEHSSANKQFSMLRFKKTNRDYLQVHHEKESDRDDIPDCCALLCDTILGFDNIPVTLTIIGGDSDVSNKEEKLPIRIDLNRHSCGNLIDQGDEICSFCFEKLY